MRTTTIAVTAIAAGAAWLTWEGIRLALTDVSASGCSSPSELAGDAAFAIAGLLMGLALLGLAGQVAGLPRLFALSGGIGAAVFGLANGVEHCAFEPFFLLYALGGLVFVVSTAILGVSVLVSGALSRWLGVLLVVAALAPMMLSFDRGGAALGGAAWLVLGVALLVVPVWTSPRPDPGR